MKRLAILLLCLTGCTQIEPPLEPVTAVIVQQEDETGVPDWYTVVEFPDGTRLMRYHVFAKPGDKFYARKTIHGHWY